MTIQAIQSTQVIPQNNQTQTKPPAQEAPKTQTPSALGTDKVEVKSQQSGLEKTLRLVGATVAGGTVGTLAGGIAGAKLLGSASTDAGSQLVGGLLGAWGGAGAGGTIGTLSGAVVGNFVESPLTGALLGGAMGAAGGAAVGGLFLGSGGAIIGGTVGLASGATSGLLSAWIQKKD